MTEPWTWQLRCNDMENQLIFTFLSPDGHTAQIDYPDRVTVVEWDGTHVLTCAIGRPGLATEHEEVESSDALTGLTSQQMIARDQRHQDEAFSDRLGWGIVGVGLLVVVVWAMRKARRPRR